MASAESVYRIDCHPGALKDLDVMHGFIRARAESYGPADRFVAAIRAETNSLDRLSDGYQVAKDPPPRRVFWMSYKRNYLVFFEVSNVERVCRVLYAWHAARPLRPNFDRQSDDLP